MSSIALPTTVSQDRTANGQPDLGYRPALDGVRGIAIALVYCYHLGEVVFGSGETPIPSGFLGVDVFFVLSGFLITSILLEEHAATGTISLKNFYMRRAIRLLPALCLFLLVLVFFAAIQLSPDAARETYWTTLYALTYSTNWVNALGIAPVSKLLGHAWSLAIEEQFYFVWPLALIAMLRLRLSRFAIIGSLIVLILLVCAHRISLVDSGAFLERVYSGSDTRADSILVGCAVAMAFAWGDWKRPSSRFALRTISLLSLFGAALCVWSVPGKRLYSFGFTPFALAVGILIAQVLNERSSIARPILESPPLVWIGKLSYGLYLWHLPVMLVWSWTAAPIWLKALGALLSSVGFAAFSFYLVERPFLKLKKRYSLRDVNSATRRFRKSRILHSGSSGFSPDSPAIAHGQTR